MASGEDPQRVLTGRIGAYTLHSRYDSRTLLEPARRGFESKFEREVDPEMVLDPEERARRAEMARKAYFARLALKAPRRGGGRAHGGPRQTEMAGRSSPPRRRPSRSRMDRQAAPVRP
jgi:hypothetical protein